MFSPCFQNWQSSDTLGQPDGMVNVETKKIDQYLNLHNQHASEVACTVELRHDLAEAVSDIHPETVVWSREHYVQFSFYLPCYWPDLGYPAQRLYQDAVEQAVLAEDLGFATLCIPEHHFINYLTHPQPLLTAIKVAAATRRITHHHVGLGLAVLRHPSSGGRDMPS